MCDFEKKSFGFTPVPLSVEYLVLIVDLYIGYETYPNEE